MSEVPDNRSTFEAPPNEGAFSFIYPPTQENLIFFSEVLQKGGVVSIPTETVYGLAADALNETACASIFKIKGRPLIDPLIVHVKSMDMLEELAEVPSHLSSIAEAFWPGPLTFILKKRASVPAIVTAGLDTVAVRMPAHPVTQSLLNIVNQPLAAPSANPFAYVSPSTAEHVASSFGAKVPYIIDGGPCNIGLESTILDLTSKVPTILRPGAITAKDLESRTGINVVQKAPKQVGSQKAPGLMDKHYSPKARVYLFDKEPDAPASPENAVVWLNRPPSTDSLAFNNYWLSEDGTLETVGQNLFSVLRKLDNGLFNKIYMQMAPNEGIGIAINDRLSRAASKNIGRSE